MSRARHRACPMRELSRAVRGPLGTALHCPCGHGAFAGRRAGVWPLAQLLPGSASAPRRRPQGWGRWTPHRVQGRTPCAYPPPRRFRQRRPQRKAIPPAGGIDDHRGRLPTMGAAFRRLCPRRRERMKTAVSRDRPARYPGFVGGSTRLPGRRSSPTIPFAWRQNGPPCRSGRRWAARARTAGKTRAWATVASPARSAVPSRAVQELVSGFPCQAAIAGGSGARSCLPRGACRRAVML